MTSTLYWWGRLAGVFAVETAVIIVFAASACRWVRKPQRRRACWQAALIAVALVFVSELAGLRGRVASWLPAETKERRLGVSLKTASNNPSLLQAPDLGNAAQDSKVRARIPSKWPGWLWVSGTIGLLLWSGGPRAWLFVERRKMPSASEDDWSIANPLLAPLRLRRVDLRPWRRVRGPLAIMKKRIKGGFFRSAKVQTTTKRLYVFVTLVLTKNSGLGALNQAVH